jgi:UDP-N-acetyl-D-mannosaminuronic acid dehydrogenase
MTNLGFDKVCVLGLGYIGLPTAAVIASRGVNVVGVDVKAAVVDRINRGQIHIVEPDLDAVTAQAVKNGHLRASTTPEEADAFVIAVPTPFHDNTADLAYVWAAARSVAPCLKPGCLVVLESTSPPGTTEKMVEIMAELRPDLRFAGQGDEGEGAEDVLVAYCPERVLPGRVLTELVENSRVIGGLSPASSERAAALYRIFCRGELNVTNARTAEMCKLTENAFRDVNIAFANELSLVCEKIGVNVWELIRLANKHPRVTILQPGPGVGGHCIAVDPWFIVEAAPDETRLIRTSREVNDGKPLFVLGKVRDAISQITGRRPVVGVLGLAFKPDVDDLRESPALHIAREVAGWGNADILVSEPNIEALPAELDGLSNVRFSTDTDALIAQSDVVLLLVQHRPYFDIKREDLEGKVVIDTRGVWS